MKNKLLLFVMILTLGLLAACGPSAAASEPASSEAAAPASPSTPVPAEPAAADSPAAGEMDVDINDKLAAGTLLLEGTDLAVTQQQAQTLVLLWQGIQSLSASDSAAGAELEAIYQQIQSAMTSEQLAAIEAMEIDPASLRETLAGLGLQIGRMGNQAGGEATGENAAEGGFPAAGIEPGLMGGPGGGAGGGMGGGMGLEGQPQAQGTPSSEMATAIAERQAAGGFNTNSVYIRPLIQLLEQKTGSAQ
ncbi:MAG: hypothetical protein GYA48_00585 [Chloroflexi bacterium]|nr:hypothetical protein [Chloroflexota bacterium]